MKIYILRHEDRTQDATFFSPLTKDGLKNSKNLVKILRKLQINKIYSSPFIRTLQTINPYCKEFNVKVNLEYSLSEIQHPHIIPEKSYQISLPEYIAEQFNYNPKYKSLFNPRDHIYPEDEKNVQNRVRKFLMELINNRITKQENILLCTHQVVCNSILKMATKSKKDIDIDFDYNYPRGALTLVFDKDEFLFESINWEK
jgi:broad specificity phosphatase PhoE